MSLKMVVGADFPRGHWMLDELSPHMDYSGYERNSTSPMPTNMLNSGDAEAGTGWYSNDYQYTRTIDTSVKHSGNQSVRFNHNQSKEISNVITSVYAAGHTTQHSVTAGTEYAYGVWVMSNISSFARMDFYWYNSAGEHLSSASGPTVPLVPNQWTWVTLKAVAPANAALCWNSGGVYKATGDAAATDYAWFDDAVMYANPSSTWEPHARFGPALVKGASRSLIVKNSSKLSVSTPVFKRGKEYLSFSVEAFVRPVFSDPANVAEQQLFGNDGAMDGLTMAGTVVSFVTKYMDGSEARASFDLMDQQSFAAVGIHTSKKNILYINGDQVAEVELTEAQRAGRYLSTGDSQSSGASTGPNSFMINSLSVYDYELDEDAAMTHYANAQDTLGAEDIAIDYHGALLEFAPEGQLAPYFQIEYSSDAEWGLGKRVDCAINDGTLYPVISQGVSVAGYWQTVIPLGIVQATIFAANLIWEGTGAEVFTSLDGETWTPARKGVALTTVPKGTVGAGAFLFVRVAFNGGIANDPSFFDNMVFSLYSTGTISNFSGREVILDKAIPESDYDVIDFHQNWGVELENGSVTIKAPVGDMGVVPKTIEVWGQRTGAQFYDNLTSATRSRTNGGPFKAYAMGEWQVRHYVFDDGFNGDIVFSGTGQIGHVILYPEALSDAVINEIYTAYTGKPKIEVEVDEVFNVHEFAGAVDIYEYDWSIESSG